MLIAPQLRGPTSSTIDGVLEKPRGGTVPKHAVVTSVISSLKSWGALVSGAISKREQRDEPGRSHELDSFRDGLVIIRFVRGGVERSGYLTDAEVTRERLTINLTQVSLGGVRDFFGPPTLEGDFRLTFLLDQPRLDRLPNGRLEMEVTTEHGSRRTLVFQPAVAPPVSIPQSRTTRQASSA